MTKKCLKKFIKRKYTSYTNWRNCLKFSMQYLHMVPQKSGAGIFNYLIFTLVFETLKDKICHFWHFRQLWLRETSKTIRIKKNAAPLPWNSLLNVAITKLKFLARILKPLYFFSNLKLKISYFQNVWKFLHILPYVTQEKYHNFSVECDSLLL